MTTEIQVLAQGHQTSINAVEMRLGAQTHEVSTYLLQRCAAALGGINMLLGIETILEHGRMHARTEERAI